MKKVIIILTILLMVSMTFAANEIHFDYQSGGTLYYLIRNSTGNVNVIAGNTFEAYTVANIATYVNTLTENGAGGCHYVNSFNANVTTPGRYWIQVFYQAGASPADGDLLIGGGVIVWNGTAEEFVIDTSGNVTLAADQEVDVTKIAGAAVSTSTAQIGVNVVSEDNIDFGATKKASINTEVDNALDTAIPDEPTDGSVNERVGNLPDQPADAKGGYRGRY